jgi:hypothetical protein
MEPINRRHHRASITYLNVVCSCCEKPVDMVYHQRRDQTIDTEQASSLQPIDGLHLVNHYGYGMKYDHDLMDLSERDIVLCDNCTLIFLRDNKWLARYLEL